MEPTAYSSMTSARRSDSAASLKCGGNWPSSSVGSHRSKSSPSPTPCRGVARHQAVAASAPPRCGRSATGTCSPHPQGLLGVPGLLPSPEQLLAYFRRVIAGAGLRLRPWATPEGNPCFLRTDSSEGLLSRVADGLEEALLRAGAEALANADTVLADRSAGPLTSGWRCAGPAPPWATPSAAPTAAPPGPSLRQSARTRRSRTVKSSFVAARAAPRSPRCRRAAVTAPAVRPRRPADHGRKGFREPIRPECVQGLILVPPQPDHAHSAAALG